MQRSTYLVFINLICLLLFSTSVYAYDLSGGVFCINDSTVDLADDFQAALDEISTTYNADADVRLIAGTYTIPDTSTGHFQVTTGHALTISGGWKGNCSPTQ